MPLKIFLIILSLSIAPTATQAQSQIWTVPLIFESGGVTAPTSACLTTPLPVEGPQKDIYEFWRNSDWGPLKNPEPSFCNPEDRNFNYKARWGGGELIFVGQDYTAEMYDEAGAAAVAMLFEQMQAELKAGSLSDYFSHFTERARKKYESWYDTETAELLKKQFVDNILAQRPVFVIDAEPIFVLYTRGTTHPVVALKGSEGTSDVQVIYFVRQDGALQRVGDNMGSAFDEIFQGTRFVDAALEEHPFSSWKKE